MPFYSPFNLPFYFNNYKYPRRPNNIGATSCNNLNFNNTTCTNSNYNNSNYSYTNCNRTHYNSKNCYNNSFGASSDFSNGTNNATIIEKPQNPKKASETDEASEAFFEIFGLKLYFDDILIMCILFFLYTEKVHDDELFICLILLLLT